jgi:hypothetical protein
MVACKVLIPFTQHVPEFGMVVGNVDDTVNLPIRYAAQRRQRGYVDYDDEAAAEEAAADEARPRSLKERRLLARSTRRAQQADREAAAAVAMDAEAPLAKSPSQTRKERRAAAASTNAAKRDGKSDLSVARGEYKAAFGKNPSPRLDAAAIRAKIAAGDAPAPSKPKRAATAKTAAKTPEVQTDAPVD